jgi:hypothetical protein
MATTDVRTIEAVGIIIRAMAIGGKLPLLFQVEFEDS